MLGQPLMPWQRLVADVGGELVESPETGNLIPAYRVVVFSVPRQNGKTTLTLGWELDRVVSWPRLPQKVTYTAQTGQDARNKLLEDQWPVIAGSPLRALTLKPSRRNGDEAIRFRSGGRIGVQASSEAAGHGSTIGLGVIDEAFKDQDDRREGSLRPAMRTIEDAQLLVMSTMGTAESYYWNRVVETGREAAERDEGSGICYFEWSADPEDDPHDPVTIAGCNPALGYTITMSTLEADRDSMDEAEWRRTGLNITDSSEANRPIPPRAWAAVQSGKAAPTEGIVFGVEASIDGSQAAIVAADRRGHVELVEYRSGTDWVPGRCSELQRAHGADVVFDPRGPARRFVEGFARFDVTADPVPTAEVAAAALTLVDAVSEKRLSVRSHPSLDEAVENGRRRWSGDQWFWGRKNAGADVSPLVAMSLAVFTASVPEAKPAEVSVRWI